MKYMVLGNVEIDESEDGCGDGQRELENQVHTKKYCPTGNSVTLCNTEDDLCGQLSDDPTALRMLEIRRDLFQIGTKEIIIILITLLKVLVTESSYIPKHCIVRGYVSSFVSKSSSVAFNSLQSGQL